MKKTIFLFSLVIAMLLPSTLNAQTSDENWVSLGEYLLDNYKKKGKYLIPKYTGAYLYVSKLAYKCPDEAEILPKGEIIFNKVSHVEKHGIPVFEKNDPIIVNELFQVLMNGKPVSGYKIQDGEDDWKIIDLNGVASISSVLLKKQSKTSNNNILNHIYVSLDPSKDPYKIKEESIKALEEIQKKNEKIKTSLNTTVLPTISLGE